MIRINAVTNGRRTYLTRMSEVELERLPEEQRIDGMHMRRVLSTDSVDRYETDSTLSGEEASDTLTQMIGEVDEEIITHYMNILSTTRDEIPIKVPNDFLQLFSRLKINYKLRSGAKFFYDNDSRRMITSAAVLSVYLSAVGRAENTIDNIDDTFYIDNFVTHIMTISYSIDERSDFFFNALSILYPVGMQYAGGGELMRLSRRKDDMDINALYRNYAAYYSDYVRNRPEVAVLEKLPKFSEITRYLKYMYDHNVYVSLPDDLEVISRSLIVRGNPHIIVKLYPSGEYRATTNVASDGFWLSFVIVSHSWNGAEASARVIGKIMSRVITKDFLNSIYRPPTFSGFIGQAYVPSLPIQSFTFIPQTARGASVVEFIRSNIH